MNDNEFDEELQRIAAEQRDDEALTDAQVRRLMAAIQRQHRKDDMRKKNNFVIRGCVVAIALLVAVADYFEMTDDTDLIDQAYVEGHAAGRAWCGADGQRQSITVPAYEGEQRTAWYRGFGLGEHAAGCEYNAALADPECYTDECVEAFDENSEVYDYYLDNEEEETDL